MPEHVRDFLSGALVLAALLALFLAGAAAAIHCGSRGARMAPRVEHEEFPD